jgi:hypothetical protein
VQAPAVQAPTDLQASTQTTALRAPTVLSKEKLAQIKKYNDEWYSSYTLASYVQERKAAEAAEATEAAETAKLQRQAQRQAQRQSKRQAQQALREKMLAEKKMLDEQKRLDEKKMLDEQKRLDEKKMLDEQKRLDEKKMLDEQKMLDEEKMLAAQQALADQQALRAQQVLADLPQQVLTDPPQIVGGSDSRDRGRSRERSMSRSRSGSRGYSTDQMRMYESSFGQLYIPLDVLKTGTCKAYKDNTCVLDLPCSKDLFDLLTKRYVTGRVYSPDAIQIFKDLAELAGFNLYDRKNCKKSELILSLK